jgi:hypothetical protein
MMNTSWDDDGESLFEMTWYGIVLGAAASWQESKVEQNNFDRDFDWAFFRNDGQQFTKVIRALGSANAGLGLNITSDDLFWRSIYQSFQNPARTSAEKTGSCDSAESAQECAAQPTARAPEIAR